MNTLLALVSLSVLLIVVSSQAPQGGPHQSQGGPHQNQGRIRRQVDQSQAQPQVDQSQLSEPEEDEEPQVGPPNSQANWTTCDITAVPRISCYDCNTRLICKPVGGLLKACKNPYRPHCNNGICSPIQSIECA